MKRSNVTSVMCSLMEFVMINRQDKVIQNHKAKGVVLYWDKKEIINEGE